nr:YkyA family protein [Oceanobacillus senegalensis]
MYIRRRALLLFIFLCMCTYLGACIGETTEEKIHKHLEKAVKLEEDFEEQQSEITKLEIKEQEIYKQIIDLGMDEFEKIVNLSEQAIEIIDERSDLMALEKESILKSKEEFQNIEKLITNIEDKNVRSKVEEMYRVMNNRYSTYEKLNNSYVTSLQLEKNYMKCYKERI